MNIEKLWLLESDQITRCFPAVLENISCFTIDLHYAPWKAVHPGNTLLPFTQVLAKHNNSTSRYFIEFEWNVSDGYSIFHQ